MGPDESKTGIKMLRAGPFERSVPSMRRIALCAAGAALLLVCGDGSGGSGPTPTILTISADSLLDGYVTNTGLFTTAGAGPLTGDLDGIHAGEDFRQFYSFSLPALPGGAVVDSVTLRLFQARVTGAPYTKLGNVIVDHLDYGTALDSADYDAAALEADIGTLSTDGTHGYKVLNATSAVLGDYGAARPRSQFRIRFSTVDGNNDGLSDYVEFGDAEKSCCPSNGVPHLVIVYHMP
jgi:hypothetical protein